MGTYKKLFRISVFSLIIICLLCVASGDTMAGFIDNWRIEMGSWHCSGYTWTAPKSVSSNYTNGNIYVLTGAQIVGGGQGAEDIYKSYKVALSNASLVTTHSVIANGHYSTYRACYFTSVKNRTYTMWHVRSDVDADALTIYHGETFIYFK